MKMHTTDDLFTTKTEIPEIVQSRANAAFSSIKMEEAEMSKKKKSSFKRPAAVATAAAVVVLAAGTAFAAANGFWSQGAEDIIHANEVQQQELMNSGSATVFDDSMAVTKDGITITPHEMIADKRGVYLTFMVTGIDENILNENADYINFGYVSCGGHFYHDVVDYNGIPALEYIVTFYPDTSVIGSTLHLSFDGLGMAYEKAGDITDYISMSTWDFDIEVNAPDSSVIFEADQLIYEPYTVTSIEISPLSMQVNFDVDGQVELGDDYNVPVLYALKMKDGTVINLDSRLEDGKPVFFRDLGKCIYKDGLTYTFDDDERLFPVSAYSTATFNTVIDPYEVAEVILQPWGEAYPWRGIPEEIIREEYGGEIPFELIDPDNIETFSVPVNN